jgi:glycosyltransferase involved in cell wall biosynthesis
MNILLVTHFLPPRHRAGTENYTLGLAKALAARGHEISVVCAEDWDSGARYYNGETQDLLDGIVVRRLHLNWSKAPEPNRVLYDSPIVEEWFDRFLQTTRPDLMHVTSTITLGVGPIRSARRTGIPMVLTLMDFWFLCPSIQLLRQAGGQLCDGATTAFECQACLCSASGLFRAVNGLLPAKLRPEFWDAVSRTPLLSRRRGLRGMLLNMAERKQMLTQVLDLPDCILAHSQFVRQVFLTAASAPVRVLAAGHDLTWLQRYKGKSRCKELRFGYIGQLIEVKGVHLLVDAFREADQGGHARLDIWGDLAADRKYCIGLEKRVAGHPRITLRGSFDRAELPAVLSGIDVIVVPSLWYENAPLVIQEAFATRTPVIASDLGGMSEAVTHELNGLLFERGDAQDLARQMRRLIDDRSLYESLRAGCPSVKSNAEEVEEMEMVYRSVVSQTGEDTAAKALSGRSAI